MSTVDSKKALHFSGSMLTLLLLLLCGHKVVVSGVWCAKIPRCSIIVKLWLENELEHLVHIAELSLVSEGKSVVHCC